ncbi:MAG: ATP-binding protein, partial [Ornithinimicrobium sp.]
MSGLPAFVGRSSLLDVVQNHLRSGRHVLLQGPAGIGKTAVAAHALKDVRAPPAPVDRLLGNESRADVLLSVLAPLGPSPPVAVDDQAAVFGWFLRRWRGRGPADVPAMVWIDDIHHCDPLSESILRHAVTTGVVQLLATHRLGEPLGTGVQALVTEGLLVPLLVDPLEPHAATDLARAVAAHPLPDATLRKVHAVTVGNPLFIREVVGAINGGLHVDSSTTLDALVGRPLRALSPECRRTLDMIAVSEPVAEGLLRPRWEDVRELVDMGLATRQPDGTVQLDHPMRREWVLHHLGSRRSDVFAELLELAPEDHVDVDPATVVNWQLHAGLDPDPIQLQAATRRAIACHDTETAMRFVAALRGPVATLLRGQALMSSGQEREGLTVLGEVVKRGPDPLRAEAAFWQARHIGLVLGDYPQAHAVLDAVDDPQLSTAIRRFVLSGRLWLWIFGPVGDQDTLREAQDFALSGPHDEGAFELCYATAAVLNQVTDPGDVGPLLRHCSSLEETVPLTTQTVGRARTVQMWWETSRGHGDKAKEVARAAYEKAVIDHDFETVALLLGSAGWFWALAGHIKQACAVSGDTHTLPHTDDWYHY